jgi:hypothetical protein
MSSRIFQSICFVGLEGGVQNPGLWWVEAQLRRRRHNYWALDLDCCGSSLCNPNGQLGLTLWITPLPFISNRRPWQQSFIMSKMWEVDPETRSKVRCGVYMWWGCLGVNRGAEGTTAQYYTRTVSLEC